MELLACGVDPALELGLGGRAGVDEQRGHGRHRRRARADFGLVDAAHYSRTMRK